MYSMVMMMALSGSAATPADHGCAGACAGACAGNACNGCGGHRLFGHGCHGGGHRLFGHGCNGGCHGGGHRLFGHGCQGACNGCAGACNGHACHGGGHRLFGHGCNGACNGGCHGGFLFGHRSHGCAGACAGCAGGAATPAKVEEIKAKPKMTKPEGGGAKPTVSADQALLIVSLPADAKLSIDDQATTADSDTRTFVTPSGLEAGKDYYYTLKAETVRDGTPLSITRVVTVKAGEETRVTIELPVATTASR